MSTSNQIVSLAIPAVSFTTDLPVLTNCHMRGFSPYFSATYISAGRQLFDISHVDQLYVGQSITHALLSSTAQISLVPTMSNSMDSEYNRARSVTLSQPIINLSFSNAHKSVFGRGPLPTLAALDVSLGVGFLKAISSFTINASSSNENVHTLTITATSTGSNIVSSSGSGLNVAVSLVLTPSTEGWGADGTSMTIVARAEKPTGTEVFDYTTNEIQRTYVFDNVAPTITSLYPYFVSSGIQYVQSSNLTFYVSDQVSGVDPSTITVSMTQVNTSGDPTMGYSYRIVPLGFTEYGTISTCAIEFKFEMVSVDFTRSYYNFAFRIDVEASDFAGNTNAYFVEARYGIPGGNHRIYTFNDVNFDATPVLGSTGVRLSVRQDVYTDLDATLTGVPGTATAVAQLYGTLSTLGSTNLRSISSNALNFGDTDAYEDISQNFVFSTSNVIQTYSYVSREQKRYCIASEFGDVLSQGSYQLSTKPRVAETTVSFVAQGAVRVSMSMRTYFSFGGDTHYYDSTNYVHFWKSNSSSLTTLSFLQQAEGTANRPVYPNLVSRSQLKSTAIYEAPLLQYGHETNFQGAVTEFNTLYYNSPFTDYSFYQNPTVSVYNGTYSAELATAVGPRNMFFGTLRSYMTLAYPNMVFYNSPTSATLTGSLYSGLGELRVSGSSTTSIGTNTRAKPEGLEGPLYLSQVETVGATASWDNASSDPGVLTTTTVLSSSVSSSGTTRALTQAPTGLWAVRVRFYDVDQTLNTSATPVATFYDISGDGVELPGFFLRTTPNASHTQMGALPMYCATKILSSYPYYTVTLRGRDLAERSFNQNSTFQSANISSVSWPTEISCKGTSVSCTYTGDQPFWYCKDADRVSPYRPLGPAGLLGVATLPATGYRLPECEAYELSLWQDRTLSGTLTDGSNAITNLATVTSVKVGDLVLSRYLPDNTTVLSVSGTTATLSGTATSTLAVETETNFLLPCSLVKDRYFMECDNTDLRVGMQVVHTSLRYPTRVLKLLTGGAILDSFSLSSSTADATIQTHRIITKEARSPIPSAWDEAIEANLPPVVEFPDLPTVNGAWVDDGVSLSGYHYFRAYIEAGSNLLTRVANVAALDLTDTLTPIFVSFSTTISSTALWTGDASILSISQGQVTVDKPANVSTVVLLRRNRTATPPKPGISYNIGFLRPDQTLNLTATCYGKLPLSSFHVEAALLGRKLYGGAPVETSSSLTSPLSSTITLAPNDFGLTSHGQTITVTAIAVQNTRYLFGFQGSTISRDYLVDGVVPELIDAPLDTNNGTTLQFVYRDTVSGIDLSSISVQLLQSSTDVCLNVSLKPLAFNDNGTIQVVSVELTVDAIPIAVLSNNTWVYSIWPKISVADNAGNVNNQVNRLPSGTPYSSKAYPRAYLVPRFSLRATPPTNDQLYLDIGLFSVHEAAVNVNSITSCIFSFDDASSLGSHSFGSVVPSGGYLLDTKSDTVSLVGTLAVDYTSLLQDSTTTLSLPTSGSVTYFNKYLRGRLSVGYTTSTGVGTEVILSYVYVGGDLETLTAQRFLVQKDGYQDRRPVYWNVSPTTGGLQGLLFCNKPLSTSTQTISVVVNGHTSRVQAQQGIVSTQHPNVAIFDLPEFEVIGVESGPLSVSATLLTNLGTRFLSGVFVTGTHAVSCLAYQSGLSSAFYVSPPLDTSLGLWGVRVSGASTLFDWEDCVVSTSGTYQIGNLPLYSDTSLGAVTVTVRGQNLASAVYDTTDTIQSPDFSLPFYYVRPELSTKPFVSVGSLGVASLPWSLSADVSGRFAVLTTGSEIRFYKVEGGDWVLDGVESWSSTLVSLQVDVAALVVNGEAEVFRRLEGGWVRVASLGVASLVSVGDLIVVTNATGIQWYSVSNVGTYGSTVSLAKSVTTSSIVQLETQGPYTAVGFDNVTHSGLVVVYTLSSSVTILAFDGFVGDRFGSSLALDDVTLVVSAPSKISGLGSSAVGAVVGLGVVYVYGMVGASGANEWVFQQKIECPDAHDLSRAFGSGLVLQDDVLVVGSPGTLVGGVSRGCVYLYFRRDDAFKLVDRLYATTETGFGSSVQLWGTNLLIRHDTGTKIVQIGITPRDSLSMVGGNLPTLKAYTTTSLSTQDFGLTSSSLTPPYEFTFPSSAGIDLTRYLQGISSSGTATHGDLFRSFTQPITIQRSRASFLANGACETSLNGQLFGYTTLSSIQATLSDPGGLQDSLFQLVLTDATSSTTLLSNAVISGVVTWPLSGLAGYYTARVDHLDGNGLVLHAAAETNLLVDQDPPIVNVTNMTGLDTTLLFTDTYGIDFDDAVSTKSLRVTFVDGTLSTTATPFSVEILSSEQRPIQLRATYNVAIVNATFSITDIKAMDFACNACLDVMNVTNIAREIKTTWVIPPLCLLELSGGVVSVHVTLDDTAGGLDTDPSSYSLSMDGSVVTSTNTGSGTKFSMVVSFEVSTVVGLHTFAVVDPRNPDRLLSCPLTVRVTATDNPVMALVGSSYTCSTSFQIRFSDDTGLPTSTILYSIQVAYGSTSMTLSPTSVDLNEIGTLAIASYSLPGSLVPGSGSRTYTISSDLTDLAGNPILGSLSMVYDNTRPMATLQGNQVTPSPTLSILFADEALQPMGSVYRIKLESTLGSLVFYVDPSTTEASTPSTLGGSTFATLQLRYDLPSLLYGTFVVSVPDLVDAACNSILDPTIGSFTLHGLVPSVVQGPLLRQGGSLVPCAVVNRTLGNLVVRVELG